MTWILDLDGVVWLADRPVAGAAAAVARARDAGHQVLFVTNNSSQTVGVQQTKLVAQGVAATHDDVITSAQAAATYVAADSVVLVCAGAGVEEAVHSRGAHPVRFGEADAVIVGLDRTFDYRRLAAASAAIRGGARFIATNDDPTYPTPDGPTPGGGALVAAVAVASGTEPVIAGKPHQAMADLVAARLDGGPHLMIGDSPSTDGAFAKALGIPFALVGSGVTDVGGGGHGADYVAADLESLVARLLS